VINQKHYNKLKPYFRELLINKDAIQLPEIARRTKVNYGKVLTYFSVYLRDFQLGKKGSKEVIKAVFKMPNGMIETWSGENNLISRFCGQYSVELYDRIVKASDSNTKWNGFD